ncbi:MAG: hypothetical protein FJX73_09150 [Armatimonadetes bacterium]|nr:hypothetical protein [Armatimonadota bacterium]
MLAAAGAAWMMLPEPALEVTHVGSGRLLWRVALREGSRVNLSYTNSIHNAPTTELFVAEGGRLRLVEVATTREAVLEYLRLDPPYEARAGLLVAKTRGPALEGFTTRIGQTGQQRLTVDGAEFPLFSIGVGEAARLTLRRVPRAILWVQ